MSGRAGAATTDAWGIDDGYFDALGVWRVTAAETRAALRAAMDAEGPAPAPADGVRVLTAGETMAVGSPAELRLEDGAVLRLDGVLPPDLPPGYHDLRTLADDRRTRLIVSPRRCHLPPGLRTWGWAAQLYAARSTRSWGIGDLADLRRLALWSAAEGAGILLVNPLPAVAPVVPQEASPYFPGSRRYRSPLYLAVEEVPGAEALGPELERLARAGRALNRSRRIDRDAVLRLKTEALRTLWRRRGDDSRFDRYRLEQGAGLQSFATFCALAERHGRDWRRWPADRRRPDSPAVARFAADQGEQVVFHQWLQWLLDEQLARAAAPLPLMQDLPIGVDPGGADAWAWQDVLASGATVGAPPDPYSPRGQNWGLPPFVPHRLRALAYGPFIETLRATLRHAGGLRIDHVMGLFRLFWIPRDREADGGAFVRYPVEDLLAIVALESQRAGAVVVGEDLGTVEEGVRERLAECGILSYRLLWFEERPPREYPAQALAAATTHDLPTIAGLWTGADVRDQKAIGLAPDEQGFAGMRARLGTMTGLVPDAPVERVIEETYRLLATAPSAIVTATLDDALAVPERPNMPGTFQEWPNWRLALPEPLEVLETRPLARAIAAILRSR